MTTFAVKRNLPSITMEHTGLLKKPLLKPAINLLKRESMLSIYAQISFQTHLVSVFLKQ